MVHMEGKTGDQGEWVETSCRVSVSEVGSVSRKRLG